MKSIFTILLIFSAFCSVDAQVISAVPVFPTPDDAVTIYFDAAQGNGGLADCGCDVYVHTGVITNLSTSSSDWKHVVTTWGVANDAWKMTPVPGQPNVYSYTISPSIQMFYSVPGTETVEELAFVFRNAAGTIVGKDSDNGDIFYPVYAAGSDLLTTFVSPGESFLLAAQGEQIDVAAASSQNAHLTLTDNGNLLTELANDNELNYTINVSGTGLHEIVFTATTASDAVSSTFSYLVPLANQIENPPAGTKLGINYTSNTGVRLLFHAPGKEFVFVTGDFSNWQPDVNYQMKRSVNGEDWWLDISGLTPGEIYRYQYYVDGELQVADPLSELVLDPFNDSYISSTTYPDLPDYPTGLTSGIVSVMRPGQTPYSWQDQDFEKPAKTDMVIYELLLRDFLSRHDYPTLLDTLDYLDRLGVNTIELMPVSEFEGNISWGYNPDFHMALDKYYGTSEDFKILIDACHERGIAVVLDVVFNHAFGQSPLAQLYWDAANNRPAADNPWLNPIPKHPFNVGYDFNHESLATKAYVKRCLEYWLQEYHVDGFRFDLSKGFTQTNNPDNVGAWGQYDASRIAILKDYADYMWSVVPGTYVILEHFADNSEEKELAEYGLMLWGNMNYNYTEAAMGYTNNSLTGTVYSYRGWSVPHLVSYMESHDEERMAFKNLSYGNDAGAYHIKDTTTALQRVALASTFFYTIPGPKMLWEFGELGYDYSINYCPNGTIADACRVDPKPIKWNYYTQPRRRQLYDIVSALIHLKEDYNVFRTTDYTFLIGQGYKKTMALNDPDMNVVVLGNFNVINENVTPPFQHTGWWYEYFSGDSLDITNATAPIAFLPGEYRLYTDVKLPEPPGGYTDYVLDAKDVYDLSALQLDIFPNPAPETATIVYYLPQSSDIRMDLFDATGKKIANLTHERQAEGEHHYDLDQSLAPGIYFVRLTVDGYQKTVRLVKI